MKYLLLILVTLSSCSIQKKCHRLEKRIVKDAKYCELVLKDTLTVKDTVYIGTIKHDSTFVMNREVDTFYLNKDRLHVRVIKEFDTLRINAQCDSVVIIREIQVPYDSVQVKEISVWLRSFGKWGKRLLWLLLFIAACAVIWRHRGKIPFIKKYV